MGLQKFWQNYKVLIVMGSSLGLIHWGWYNLKTSPLLHKDKEDFIPEPGIVSYVSPSSAANGKLAGMKPQSWIRRNWLLAAGGAFVSIHLLTWLMQRTMKHTVRSEVALRQKPAEDRVD